MTRKFEQSWWLNTMQSAIDENIQANIVEIYISIRYIYNKT